MITLKKYCLIMLLFVGLIIMAGCGAVIYQTNGYYPEYNPYYRYVPLYTTYYRTYYYPVYYPVYPQYYYKVYRYYSYPN